MDDYLIVHVEDFASFAKDVDGDLVQDICMEMMKVLQTRSRENHLKDAHVMGIASIFATRLIQSVLAIDSPEDYPEWRSKVITSEDVDQVRREIEAIENGEF